METESGAKTFQLFSLKVTLILYLPVFSEPWLCKKSIYLTTNKVKILKFFLFLAENAADISNFTAQLTVKGKSIDKIMRKCVCYDMKHVF